MYRYILQLYPLYFTYILHSSDPDHCSALFTFDKAVPYTSHSLWSWLKIHLGLLFWSLKCVVPVMSKYTHRSWDASQVFYVHGMELVLCLHYYIWIIISPKFEISMILWSWYGRRLRHIGCNRHRPRRTPRIVFRITAPPMHVWNSYLTQLLMTQSGITLSILENIGKPKWPPAAILCKYDEKVCALHNLITNAPINFMFDVATDLL